ncbi:hypothetical protein KTT_16740 [Tengunoibacter tsumagoiensis]|uniref:Uncharacterized protein n=1 Tax=Tengunoibacter tsumagoiensis TaxID=2014871 RepID=A0A401ZY97_9CHLR|nr:hypothetical protein KTT_16740 [Tengunoibacter tsumagoiensis]
MFPFCMEQLLKFHSCWTPDVIVKNIKKSLFNFIIICGIFQKMGRATLSGEVFNQTLTIELK